MFTDQKIAFIGGGVMGEAMIRGLLGQKIVAAEQVLVADPWDERRDYLAGKYNIYATADNREAAEEGQVVVLSIKPQSIPYVLPEIRGHLRRGDLLLSIIAGTPIRKLSDGAAHASVIRAMPNTPALVGSGATGAQVASIPSGTMGRQRLNISVPHTSLSTSHPPRAWRPNTVARMTMNLLLIDHSMIFSIMLYA